ncbi:MAG: hypothetical protein IKW91_04630, partial [Bacteroidaceae bacterium]|nr:hypothetical protein [Bacteroidaceae bacterium]
GKRQAALITPPLKGWGANATQLICHLKEKLHFSLAFCSFFVTLQSKTIKTDDKEGRCAWKAARFGWGAFARRT